MPTQTTEQTKHTPGPWSVTESKGNLCAWKIASDSRPTVAFVAQTIGNNQEENHNARLIAAAPDLLKALQDISDSYDSTGCEFCGVVSEEAIQAVNEAIRKATQP